MRDTQLRMRPRAQMWLKTESLSARVRPVPHDQPAQRTTAPGAANREGERASDYQRLLVELATRFTSLPPAHYDQGLRDALGRVGDFFGADRVALYAYDWEAGTVTQTHEWRAPGAALPPGDMAPRPFSADPETAAGHRRGEIVRRPFRAASAAAPAAPGRLTLPLRAQGDCFGCLALEFGRAEPGWLDDDLARLQVSVELITRLTLRQQAERALRNARDDWEQTFNTIPDLIFVLDRNHRILRANRAALAKLGVRAGQALGAPCFACMHGLGEPPPDCPHALLLADGLAHESAHDIPALGGWYHVSVMPLRNARGEVAGSVHVARDVTARRQAESQRLDMERRLLNAQKMDSLGIMAGGIAHDFNNLLMAIHGNLELIGLELPADAGIQESLRDALSATRQAAELTRQMLAYVGQGRFAPTRLRLDRALAEVEASLRDTLNERVELRIECQSGVPDVRADEGQVRQVLHSLVANARESLPPDGGVISIQCGVGDFDAFMLQSAPTPEKIPPGRYAYLRVSDTGSGMDAATRARIFDPFFTTKFAGRGLGLPAVLGIMQTHGGAVLVESAPGAGTTVQALFPLSSAAAASQPAAVMIPPPAPRAAAAPRGRGILVVDDEESVRAVACKVLRKLGFEPFEAGDGIEGLEQLARHHAELRAVLLDLAMPRMDGVATLQELRRRAPDLKVILTTGYDEDISKKRLGELVPDGLLNKPYDIDQLEAVLNQGRRI